MYQTAGSEAVEAMAQCMNLPLYRRAIAGSAVNTHMEYQTTPMDEVEDLVALLQSVLAEHPEIKSVISGAILSTYQRLRVENVCKRLGLTSIAPLWQRNQRELLDEMLQSGMHAVLVKVASMGLGKSDLNKPLELLREKFLALDDAHGFHVCGEGGEYESIVLDCPLFTHGRIALDEVSIVSRSEAAFAPVCGLAIHRLHIEPPLEGARQPLEALELPRFNPPQPPSIPARVTLALKSSDDNIGPRISGRSDSGHLFFGPCLGADAEQALSTLGSELIAQARRSVADVAFCLLLVSDMSDFLKVNQAYDAFFAGLDQAPPPSRATVELEMQGVAVYAVARRSSRTALLVRSLSMWAPVTIGPYAQCNVVDGRVALVAGQIGLEPMSMLLHETLEAQGVAAVRHCEAVLRDDHVCGKGLASCARSVIVYVSTRRGSLGATAESLLSSAFELFKISLFNNLVKCECILVPVPCLPRNALIEVEVMGWVTQRESDEPGPPDDLFSIWYTGHGSPATSPGGWARIFVADMQGSKADATRVMAPSASAYGPGWGVLSITVPVVAVATPSKLTFVDVVALEWQRY